MSRPPGSTATPAQVGAVLAARVDGLSIAAAAREAGVTVAVARGILAREGDPGRTAADVADARERVMALWGRRMSYSAIAEELGLSSATVGRVVRERTSAAQRAERSAVGHGPSNPSRTAAIAAARAGGATLDEVCARFGCSPNTVLAAERG